MTSNAKEEQLARVRRNQQRCRERKRAHVLNLEEQIQHLQERLRQCTPCASPPIFPPSSHPEQIHTAENDARRELLLALGISLHMQQQYIDSTAKRQAVRTILADLEQPDRAVAPDDSTDTLNLGNSPSRNEQRDEQSLTSTLAAPLTDDWWTPTDPAPTVPMILDDANHLAWLTNLSPLGHQFATAATTPAQSSFLPLSDFQSQQCDNETPTMTEQTSDLSSCCASPLDRCFFETAIRFRPGKAATSCSIAISMVMQHNRKGLSLAELHEIMKPGFSAATDTSGECQMNNAVLLNVLTEIIAGE